MEVVHFKDLEILVERRAFLRGYSLLVHPERPIRVRAGFLKSQKEILGFVAQHQSWLEKQRSRILEHKKASFRPLVAGQTFPFRGKLFKLKPVITLAGQYFFSLTESELLVHVPREFWCKNVESTEFLFLVPKLRELYRRESLRHLQRRVELHSQQLGLVPKKLRWTETKTRWGSCTSQGSIQLNWRIIVFSDAVIDYIIIHELVHLRFMNHSKDFWGAVGEVLPHYRELRKELRKQQLNSEFLAKSSATGTLDLE